MPAIETIVSSSTKEVRIGTEHPFVVIGERINPTGRKLLAEEMKAGNLDRVVQDAIARMIKILYVEMDIVMVMKILIIVH